MDMTLFYRQLSFFDNNFEKHLPLLISSSYAKNFEPHIDNWQTWFKDYQHAIEKSNIIDRQTLMCKTNPKYIFRNYMAQIAIEAAEKEDYCLINTFFKISN